MQQSLLSLISVQHSIVYSWLGLHLLLTISLNRAGAYLGWEALCQNAPFGLPVMFEYVPHNSTQNWAMPPPPLWNLGRKSRQKNGLNLTLTWVKTFFFFFFFGLHLNLDGRTGWIRVKTFFFLSSFFWSSCFSSGFYLPFQISGYAPGPFFWKSCVRH